MAMTLLILLLCDCCHSVGCHGDVDDNAVAMTMLSMAVDKLLTMARMDDDHQVVMTILESTSEMLDDIKKPVLDAVESPAVFVSVIKDVFQQKVNDSYDVNCCLFL